MNGFKEGYIPKEAITYKEEEGRAAFQDGKLIFHRQWPYQYNLANGDEGTKVKGKFAVAPLPGLDGPGASSLGGHNLGDLDVLQEQGDRAGLHQVHDRARSARRRTSSWPRRRRRSPSLYDDPALQEKFPYLPTLRDSINNAVPRPKVVRYGDASTAIQDAAYAALTGTKSSADALKELQSQLEEITEQVVRLQLG